MSQPQMKRTWKVLLIGGASGTGKTTIAKAVAEACGVTWVQLDDIRLAFEASDIRFGKDSMTDAFHFFTRTPNVWNHPANHLCERLVAVGELMSDAISIVIGNHIVQGDPAVIEGDLVLPGLIDRPEMKSFIESGELQVVFLMPSSEDSLLQNMITRGRGLAAEGRSPQSIRMAETNWLFSQWLEHEAAHRHLNVIQSRPDDSTIDRIVRVPEPG